MQRRVRPSTISSARELRGLFVSLIIFEKYLFIPYTAYNPIGFHRETVNSVQHWLNEQPSRPASIASDVDENINLAGNFSSTGMFENLVSEDCP